MTGTILPEWDSLPEYYPCYFCNTPIERPAKSPGPYQAANYWCSECPEKFPEVRIVVTTLNNKREIQYAHIYTQIGNEKEVHFRINFNDSDAHIYKSTNGMLDISHLIYKYKSIPDIGPHNIKSKIQTILTFL